MFRSECLLKLTFSLLSDPEITNKTNDSDHFEIDIKV